MKRWQAIALTGTAATAGTLAAILLIRHYKKKKALAPALSEQKGEKGDPGEPGIGIEKTEIVNGELILTYTNGETVNLGAIVQEESDFDFFPMPNGTYGIKAGKKLYLDELTLPKTYCEKPITAILPNAFENAVNLVRLTLPESITYVSESAFRACKKLIYHQVDGVNYLGSGENPCLVAVSPLSKELRTLTLAPTCKVIADAAFADCDKLESVSVPADLSHVGFGAFFGCTSLERVEIEDVAAWCSIHFDCSHENYSANPLCYADKLLINGVEAEHLVIPEGVTALPCCACSSSALKTVSLPSTLVKIGDFAFDKCRSLECISIPASVSKIGKSILYECEALSEITVDPENTVYHSAENCLIETASKTLIAGCAASVIPSDGSVTAIGDFAFSGCDRLARLVIPESVSTLGASAFLGCTDLEQVSIPFPKSTTHLGQLFAADTDVDPRYFVPRSLKDIALTGDEIPTQGLTDCDSIVRATIGSGINRIGAGAFGGCRKLISVVFENPIGWTVNETSINTDDLSNPTTAANLLTHTYVQNVWERK